MGWMHATTMLALAAAFLLAAAPAEGADPNVVDVWHTPSGTVTPEDEVSVYIELEDTSNVTEVSIEVCVLEPRGSCRLPEEMTLESGTTYSHNIGRFDGGTTVGYNITIEYDDGNSTYAGEEEYFTFQVQQVATDDGGDDSMPFPGAPLVAATIGLVVVLQRRRR